MLILFQFFHRFVGIIYHNFVLNQNEKYTVRDCISLAFYVFLLDCEYIEHQMCIFFSISEL